jgi:GGDEF domain-containing protein
LEINGILPVYKEIGRLYSENRRNRKQSEIELISKQIIKLDTVGIDEKLSVLISKFQKQCLYTFFPVIDTCGYPLGIIHEKSIKPFIYSPYGQDLLKYKSIVESIENIMTKCPVIDVTTRQEKILEIFVNNPESEGVIIVEENRYIGFLTAKSLLHIINEKNISEARELNPLSKLPGNILINRYISKVYARRKSVFYIIYFDFDYFKPFNDRFGFRQGDRAIIVFCEILKKKFHRKNCFIGHIGGDDFFLGIELNMNNVEKVYKTVEIVLDKFSSTVSAFYSSEEKENGYYVSKDRNGNSARFNFLTATAVIMELGRGKRKISREQLVFKLAELKKEAKFSKNRIYKYSYEDSGFPSPV